MKKLFKTKINRLNTIGFQNVKKSEWTAPTFTIPKKNETVCFISDLRELNKRIERKPFPIPRI